MLRPVLRTTRSGTRSFHIPHDCRPPHMDELPLPCGSWQEAHDKAQAKYNMQLAVGVVTLIGTIVIGRMNGMLWLNYKTPVPPKE